MDPKYSAQDVVRCTLCRTEVAPMYCNVCHTHLCKDCVVKHFSDKSKAHIVVPLEQFLSSLDHPKCSKHPSKQLELHCEQCDISICKSCISSKEHLGHKAIDLFEVFETKKKSIKKDLQELEKSILPKYQEVALKIEIQKTDQSKNFKTLTSTLKKHGDAMHKEIDTIVQSMQSEINEKSTKQLVALGKQEDALKHIINEIKRIILDLKRSLDANDIYLISKYESRIEEFLKMPPHLKAPILLFQPRQIQREKLIEQFGSLSTLSAEKEQDHTRMCQRIKESSSLDMAFLNAPRLITKIDSRYNRLYSLSCLSDEEIWTRGRDTMMRLYNLQGELVKSVQSKSGNVPTDIDTTRRGNLVYTDYDDRSINIVKKKDIQTLIRLRRWRPRGICSTSADDLLVTMDSEDNIPTKVVRYSGSTEKQSIQMDDQGKPLYSSDDIKYLSENKNLDICVADYFAGAVVVVSAAGKLRFRYTGPISASKGPFKPFGITTDSQGRILAADRDNHDIHIMGQDGHFLRYIDNYQIQFPFGLCVDSTDNLFVAEFKGKVKKFQYYK